MKHRIKYALAAIPFFLLVGLTFAALYVEHWIDAMADWIDA